MTTQSLVLVGTLIRTAMEYSDASENLIALLTYGTENSAAGGYKAFGTSAFLGRLILI